MSKITSVDGTVIGYDRVGRGPAVVLVDGAMCYREFGPMPALARELAPHFTVYCYDRRGRGESGDAEPYAVAREVEDLAAVLGAAVGAAGEPVFVCGLSSGAALALHAAASGLPIGGLALYEPPFTGESERVKEYGARLAELLADGRRGDAAALFMRHVGMAEEALAGMRQGPAWPLFEAVAPTLPYDHAVLGDGAVPAAVAARVAVPTLVADGGESPGPLRAAARGTAEAVPGAEYRTLPGQTHQVAPEVLAGVLREFFMG